MTTRLTLFQEAPCAPVTLEEARNHLAIDSTTRADDSLIQLLIEAASADAENRTGRIWVESLWEWSESDGFIVGQEYEFPTVPVTKVQIYNLDEEIPEGGEATDLSGSLVKCYFPSPQPQGSPMIGSLLPIAVFPTNYRLLLTVGYPVTEVSTPIEQKDNPVLSIDKTTYTTNKVHLVFNRSVSCEISGEDGSCLTAPTSFELRDAFDKATSPTELVFEKGGVSLVFEEGFLTESSVYSVSFVGGLVKDEFDNYVDVISAEVLPVVTILTEDDFIIPDEVPATIEYVSKAPARIKDWIMTRTNTLYSQRSEIALRAGKSNDALFDERFIDVLLQPFKVGFV